MCWVFLISSTFAATEEVTYIHTDISGSPMAATDAAGTILWRESYRGYGERWMNQAASAHQNQWFHGKELDATGMQYFGARYYDPEIGRFTGIDPVGFREGNLHSFNRFAYGNNNPIKNVDPDGRMSIAALSYLVLAGIILIGSAKTHQDSTQRRSGGITFGKKDSIVFNDSANDGGNAAKPNDTSLPDTNRGNGLHPDGLMPPVADPGGLNVGDASRDKERERGGKSIWDANGGEWRGAPEDKWHNPHWDYNPHNGAKGGGVPWQNVPHGDLPVKK